MTSNADSGPGTLRHALANAADGDTINFSVTGAITLTSGELLITRNVSIAGPAPARLAISGNAVSRVLHVVSNKVVTIANLMITWGYDFGSGGGGILNDHGGLTISNCTLSGNFAVQGWGGAILNEGSLFVVNSTLSGNSAGSYGGGIFSRGTFGGITTLHILNSTFKDNSAPSFYGSAIFNDGIHGTANMVIGSTILDVGASGYGLFHYAGTNEGTFTSLGYNLSSDNGGHVLTNATDLINTDSLLGPLPDNGGPTPTHALLCGSPAIDAGTNFAGSATDQRGAGFSRTFDDPHFANAAQGDGTDIGAFESQGLCTARFVAISRETNGIIRLEFAGEPGRAYLIEASADFKNWETIGMFPARQDGLFTFEDPRSINLLHRFYRVRLDG